jgi:hypothetical protein
VVHQHHHPDSLFEGSRKEYMHFAINQDFKNRDSRQPLLKVRNFNAVNGILAPYLGRFFEEKL